MNIENIVRNNLCVQCGTCASICPQDVIVIKEYKKSGLLYPHLGLSKCIHCGLCQKVCPVNDFSLHVKALQNYRSIGIYSACRGNDPSLVSSSGGLVSSIIKHLFNHDYIDKAIVAVMDKNRVLEPRARIIYNMDDMDQAQGSIYQPVPLNVILENINKNDRVGYVGLPCHVKGLRRFIEAKEMKDLKLYAIGLCCNIGRAKNATRFLIRKYVKERGARVERVFYRAGVYPGNLVIKVNSQSICVPFKEYITRIGYLFTPKGCLFCDDLFNEEADISVGDPWGIEEEKKAILISRNEKGQRILNEMVNSGIIFRTRLLTKKEAILTQNYKHKEKRVFRAVLCKKMHIAVPNKIHKELCFMRNIKLSFFDTVLSIALLFNSRLFNSRFYLIAGMLPFPVLEKVAFFVKSKYKHNGSAGVSPTNNK